MNVLFVCSGNIGRSQMAMEFFKRLSDERTASAGTRVTVENEAIGGREDAQIVLQAMQEEGIDMSNNTRKSITPEMLDYFDKVIVLAEPERIPEWLRNSPNFDYWETTKVKNLPLEDMRTVRDDIKTKVIQFIQSQSNPVW